VARAAAAGIACGGASEENGSGGAGYVMKEMERMCVNKIEAWPLGWRA
jgi:hypothetical protein